jgi:hypothetical protein
MGCREARMRARLPRGGLRSVCTRTEWLVRRWAALALTVPDLPTPGGSARDGAIAHPHGGDNGLTNTCSVVKRVSVCERRQRCNAADELRARYRQRAHLNNTPSSQSACTRRNRTRPKRTRVNISDRTRTRPKRTSDPGRRTGSIYVAGMRSTTPGMRSQKSARSWQSMYTHRQNYIRPRQNRVNMDDRTRPKRTQPKRTPHPGYPRP